MNRKITPHFLRKLSKRCSRQLGLFFLISATATGLSVSAQTTYTFTSAGLTGPIGPSQGAINTAYANTNLAGLVTVSGAGIQSFVVPHNGVYRITAVGGQGGYAGGRGASMAGNFTLTAGTTLKILVGQAGTEDYNGQFYAGGGGGGSYVANNSNTPLVVAGGGGGNGDGYNGNVALCCSTTMEGNLGSNGNPYPGGSNGGSGAGGGICSSWSDAGGGAGFTGDGNNCNAGSQAKSFINGGQAGLGNGLTGDGGFGGGGGCYNSGTGQRGGGGGGYSGGGGGVANSVGNDAAGGGGGSYNGGTSQTNSLSATGGDGWVTVTDLCNLNISATSNPLCAGGTVTLTTNAISNISWSPGGSTNASIIVSPGTTTSYSVTGMGSAPECMGSIRTNVVVVSISPLPVIASMVTPTLLCMGSTGTITAMGASTYTLLGNPGQSHTVNPSVSTVYTVSGTSSFGCVNTGTVMVTVNTNTLGGTPNTSVCKGKTIMLTATGGVNYMWNNIMPFPSMNVTPLVATVYTVNATDIYGCALSRTVSVSVNDIPVITATPDKNVVCIGEPFQITASGATTYTWSNNVQVSSINVTPTVDIVYAYTVTGTDANSCNGTKTVSVVVSKCSAIGENISSLPARIFPNPNNGSFVISVNEFSAELEVKMYNALGSLIKSQKLTTADANINIQNEANGVYFLYLVKGGKTVNVSKIVKQ